MSATTDAHERFFDENMAWSDEFPEREPSEFDCPDCDGPAHCRTECDRRFVTKQREVDAWHNVWKHAREHVCPEVQAMGDALVEPF